MKKSRRGPAVWLAALLPWALVVGVGSCRTAPPTILLHVRAEAGLPSPDELRLNVLSGGGFEVRDRRLPEQGRPQIPADVVLYPPRAGSPLWLWVRATAGGARVGEGTASATPIAGQQVEATVVLAAATLPDQDGDSVPDVIDNCPTRPNPEQGPCPGADGGHDQRPDSPTDGQPDVDCDKDHDTYLSRACGGDDCDDGNPAVNPGQKEGPAGSARCSDGLDNDCDGAIDGNDTGCKTCVADSECDDKSFCTRDNCAGGKCQNISDNEGQTCDDGNACTQNTRCTSGLCTGGSPVTCPVGSNPCQPLSCDPTVGCTPKPLSDGSGCSDGLYCTDGDTCTGGVCTPGKARDCHASAPVCRSGTCNETADTCSYTPVTAGTSCDDKDACTQGESCDASGACVAPQPLVELAAALPMTWATDRSTRVDSKSYVHTVLRQGGGSGPGTLVYATNASGSWKWETVDSSSDTGSWPSLVLGAQDALHIAYHDEAKTQVMYATKGSTGWTTSQIDAGSGFTSIAIDGSGKLHVSYVKTFQLWYATGSAGAWTKTLVNDPSVTTSGVGYHSSLALDAQGKVHIAHGEGGQSNWYGQPIALRYSTNSSGSWVTTTPAAATITGAHGQYASLALTSGGDLFISHSSTSGYGNGVLYLTSRIGGTWKTETVTSGNNSGGFSSLVVNSQGKVYIAYRQPGLSELRLAVNTAGTWQTQKLDGGTSTTFGWPSMAQAKSGMLHITYKPGETPTELKHIALGACP